jgi:hypothetical protein
VRDEGKIIEQFHWASLSSPAVGIDDNGRPNTKLPTLTLQPGEAHIAGIYLSTLRNYLHMQPSRNRVEAVFVYDETRQLAGWRSALSRPVGSGRG